jgi:hypothetical protein
MPKKIMRLIILFTVFFIIGVNPGDSRYLLNLGNALCQSGLGVG